MECYGFCELIFNCPWLWLALAAHPPNPPPPKPPTPHQGAKFFQFHEVFGKFGKILCWRHPWRVGAPFFRASWIRPWSGQCKWQDRSQIHSNKTEVKDCLFLKIGASHLKEGCELISFIHWYKLTLFLLKNQVTLWFNFLGHLQGQI